MTQAQGLYNRGFKGLTSQSNPVIVSINDVPYQKGNNSRIRRSSSLLRFTYRFQSSADAGTIRFPVRKLSAIVVLATVKALIVMQPGYFSTLTNFRSLTIYKQYCVKK